MAVVLFAIPITAQKIYSSSTMYIIKNELTTAIDSLTNQISTEISYINNSTIFYIYSLTSKKFRKEVSQIISSLFAHSCYKKNIVKPIPSQLKQNPTATIVQIDHQQNQSNWDGNN
jgi:hypothetical protein